MEEIINFNWSYFSQLKHFSLKDGRKVVKVGSWPRFLKIIFVSIPTFFCNNSRKTIIYRKRFIFYLLHFWKKKTGDLELSWIFLSSLATPRPAAVAGSSRSLGLSPQARTVSWFLNWALGHETFGIWA